MTNPKTSTFTVHHDQCDPGKWTAKDVLAFADFVRTGDMRYAAALARLGVQLVLSEHHVPKGGQLEEVGWALPGASDYYDLEDVADDDVTEVCRIYRGPVEYVAKLGIGNEEGDLEGYEYEVKPTLAEAQKFFDDAHANPQ